MNKKKWSLLLFAVSILFSLRLFIFQEERIRPHGDGIDYLLVAKNISERGKFSDPVRLPGYPLFILMVKKMFFSEEKLETPLQGKEYLLAQNILACASALIFFFLILRTTQNYIFSLLAMFFAFTNPFWIEFEGTLLSETLTVFFLLSSLLCMKLFLGFRDKDIDKATKLLIASFILSFLLFLTKPSFAFLPPLFFLTMNIGRFNKKIFLSSFVMTGIFLGIFFGFSYHHQKRYGFFNVSSVGNINTFGKALQLKLWQDERFKDTEISQVMSKIEKEGRFKLQISYILNEIKNRTPHLYDDYCIQLSDWGRMVLKSNRETYFFSSVKILWDEISSYLRNNYFAIRDHVTIQYLDLWHSNFFGWMQYLLLAVSLRLLIIALFKKYDLFLLLNCVIIIALQVLSAFMSYGEFIRLRMPIEPLLYFVVLISGFSILFIDSRIILERVLAWKQKK